MNLNYHTRQIRLKPESMKIGLVFLCKYKSTCQAGIEFGYSMFSPWTVPTQSQSFDLQTQFMICEESGMTFISYWPWNYFPAAAK